MIRILDILFSFLGLILLAPVIIILIIIGYLDTGSPLFFQERVGRGKRSFRLVKLRSMYLNSPSVATHLVNYSSITPFGRFIRKLKLDELPQLFNVLKGDMSLVGPRPNLFNQLELIAERELLGVYDVRPGITGLAQIKKIDMTNPRLLAQTDAKMIRELNTLLFFRYIFLTLLGKGLGDRVK